MSVCYYIARSASMVKNTKKSEVGDLSNGERIITLDTNMPIILNSKDLEGPFYDLKGLIENSLVYKELQNNNPRRAHKIIQPENIRIPESHILVPKGRTFKVDFVEAFVHSIFGEFDENKVKGIHFYDEKKVKIIEVIDSNDKGVFKAKIEAYDFRTLKWKAKEKPTNFFPQDWDKTVLLDELYFADKSKILRIGKEKIYDAVTKSGVNVVFVIENGKIKTIYPVL
jgi:hypothetical protein